VNERYVIYVTDRQTNIISKRSISASEMYSTIIMYSGPNDHFGLCST